MTGFLLVNPGSGAARPTADELRAEAERRGIRVHVLREGDDPARLAREADADALGAAGGDGTLGSVADVAIERDLPFVCVPFGTRNHFARDVGLDRDDPAAALASFEEGSERRVDVGRVNGRVFLNNVSIGAYARLVHRRERHRRRGEAAARLRALVLTARGYEPARLLLDGAPVAAPIVLVANNAYKVELFELGERERVDTGLLHLYVARGLVPRTWEERAAPAFTLDSDRRLVALAADGEPLRLEAPLTFESQAGALRLLVPRERARSDEAERGQEHRPAARRGGNETEGASVHEQPEPTQEERDEDEPRRRDEEDAMRGPGHDDPREVIDPDPDSGDD